MSFKAKQRKKVVLQSARGEWHPPLAIAGRSNNTLERLHVTAVYGYNAAMTIAKKRSSDLWGAILKHTSTVRSTHPHTNMIIAGDMNATVDTLLDTDRPEATAGDKEADSKVIETLQAHAFHDVFRTRFPATKAWTHEGLGLNEDKVKRRLDICMTDSY